jgi:hypothetical protein
MGLGMEHTRRVDVNLNAELKNFTIYLAYRYRNKRKHGHQSCFSSTKTPSFLRRWRAFHLHRADAAFYRQLSFGPQVIVEAMEELTVGVVDEPKLIIVFKSSGNFWFHY